jgi:hypothetical protein
VNFTCIFIIIERRVVHHDSPITESSSTADIPVVPDQMATSTSSHLQPNPSVFTYRTAAPSGNPIRHRVIAEAPSNTLLLSAERYKSNISSSLRQTRHQSITTAYIPPQQTQRNTNQNTKSRVQLEKLTHSRG